MARRPGGAAGERGRGGGRRPSALGRTTEAAGSLRAAHTPSQALLSRCRRPGRRGRGRGRLPYPKSQRPAISPGLRRGPRPRAWRWSLRSAPGARGWDPGRSEPAARGLQWPRLPGARCARRTGKLAGRARRRSRLRERRPRARGGGVRGAGRRSGRTAEAASLCPALEALQPQEAPRSPGRPPARCAPAPRPSRSVRERGEQAGPPPARARRLRRALRSRGHSPHLPYAELSVRRRVLGSSMELCRVGWPCVAPWGTRWGSGSPPGLRGPLGARCWHCRRVGVCGLALGARGTACPAPGAELPLSTDCPPPRTPMSSQSPLKFGAPGKGLRPKS